MEDAVRQHIRQERHKIVVGRFRKESAMFGSNVGPFVPGPRECPSCGGEFRSEQPARKYCSDACKRDMRNARKRRERAAEEVDQKYRHCLLCGIPVIADRNAKYCCVEHRKISKQERMKGIDAQELRNDQLDRLAGY